MQPEPSVAGGAEDISSAPSPLRLREMAVALLAFVREPDWIDESRLRLGVAALLSAAGLLFFRQDAAVALIAAVFGAGVTMAVLYFGFHRVGFRVLGRFWPGPSRGLGTALFFFCLCPPRLPVVLVAGLSALAVLIEGATRRLVVPLAISGVLVAWPLAWLWHQHFGLPYIRPFELRPLDEPVMLWTKFQQAVDPVRLYTGNVAGPLGATSFGAAGLGFLALAYARKASWLFALAFFVPLAIAAAAAGQPLTVYLISGPALVLAAVIAAESRRLPRALGWQAGGGILAGALSATLLLRGAGSEAYGAGVVVATALLSAFQFFGLAGAPGVVGSGPVRKPAAEPPAQQPVSALQLLTMVLLAPVGLALVWRDQTIPRSQRVSLLTMGLAIYALAVAGSLVWLWLLRLPS